MKPIQLTMTAFGPYKGTEVIDFRELEEHRLFVVSGCYWRRKDNDFRWNLLCFIWTGKRRGSN